MTRRAWLVVIALALGLQAIVLWRYCGGRTATHSPTLRRGALAGDAAPALALESDGVPTPWTPAAGRPQLVHFWATWCPPCVAELPTLLAEARAAGAPLLAASLDDGWPAIAAFFAPGPVPAEVARVVDRAGPARFGAAALPDSYLVDADGRLRERLPGAQSWASPAGRAALRAVAIRGDR